VKYSLSKHNTQDGSYLAGLYLSLIVKKVAQLGGGGNGFQRNEITGRVRYITQLLFKMATILIL